MTGGVTGSQASVAESTGDSMGDSMAGEVFDRPDLVVVPDGPLLVRGATSIQDAEGEVHQVRRPVVALCRCDKSSRLPWCDGTHKVIPR